MFTSLVGVDEKCRTGKRRTKKEQKAVNAGPENAGPNLR